MSGNRITPQDLPLNVGPAREETPASLPLGMTINEAVEDLERRMIVRALAEADGVAAHAAQALGLTKSNLAYKIKKYGLN